MSDFGIIASIFKDMAASGTHQRIESKDGVVALYHAVYTDETFDQAAEALVTIVRHAEDMLPGHDRHLFLDIDGHRNPAGGFDDDMVELQQEFVLGFLSGWLTEVSMPLTHVRNNLPQKNDVPETFSISTP